MKQKLLILLTTSYLLLTACTTISYTLPGTWERSITTEAFLTTIKATEDLTFYTYTGDFTDNWQEDKNGKYLVLRSAKGFMTIRQDGDDYNFSATVNDETIKGDFKTCISYIDANWQEKLGQYDERVLSIEEAKQLFVEVDLTKENYQDYIGFKQIDTENEITGYDADYRKKYRPYKYMINTYVGPGQLLADMCEKINCSGTVDREVTIKIYDLDYRLCSTEVDQESSGHRIAFNNSFNAIYLDDEDSYTIHFTPYMDPLESWYIKTFSNGLKEVHQTLVEVSNINIEEASGKVVYFNTDNTDVWNLSPDSKKYIAIKTKDGNINRLYESEDYIGQLRELLAL